MNRRNERNLIVGALCFGSPYFFTPLECQKKQAPVEATASRS